MSWFRSKERPSADRHQYEKDFYIISSIISFFLLKAKGVLILNEYDKFIQHIHAYIYQLTFMFRKK